MTLIAGIVPVKGSITLIGDTLISGVSSKSEIVIPSTGITRLHSSAMKERKIVWMIQKICLVAKRLAIAWADDYCAARRIINKFSENNVHSHYDKKLLDKILSQCEYEDIKKVNLISLSMASKDNIIIYPLLNMRRLDSPKVKIFVAGSGERSLLKFLPSIHEHSIGKVTNEGIASINRSIVLAGMMLGRQIFHEEYISDFFGGIFEIAYFEKNRVAKVDNTTYVFWVFDKKESRLYPMPMIIKIFYYNKILVVQRAQLETENMKFNNDPRNSGFHYFTIDSFIKCATDEEIAAIARIAQENNFNSHHQCHYVHVPDNMEQLGRGLSGALGYVNCYDSQVKFEISGNGVQMRVSVKVANDIISLGKNMTKFA